MIEVCESKTQGGIMSRGMLLEQLIKRGYMQCCEKHLKVTTE